MYLRWFTAALPILFLALTACSTPATPPLATVETEPTQVGISEESHTAEITITATVTQDPYPVPPKSETSATPTPLPPYPAPGDTTPSPTQPPFPAPGDPTHTAAPLPNTTWEGPRIIYSITGIGMLSYFDGSQKSSTDIPFDYFAPDFSPETGRMISVSDNSIWFIDQGWETQNILSLDQYIESPIISSDGTKIAYSLAHGFGDNDIQQLWIINPDGTGNTLLIEDTGQYITDPGPFRLRPIAWSADNTKVYMVTTTDSEATPTGMYAADLATGTITKALTPQVTLWNVSFSPDRTKIAYRTFQWKPLPGLRPEPGPPFTLNVTDLTTGATRILLESSTDQYFHPIWSRDGNRLAYATRPGILEADLGLFTIDLTTGVTTMIIPGSEFSRLRPWRWLSEDRLVYTDGDLSSGDTRDLFTTLYTISIDRADQHSIDSGREIIVLGVLED